ncbi:esterase/lipase family protein [Streptomyces sp. NPDC056480]|uniref:esterase/lipase family protein n=1 Tax=Streptomyces sp. NPDC056480 TaxID=3345833 RepID=UPI003685D3D5
MRDLVVVVPGIMGSVLSRDGKPVWSTETAALVRGLGGITKTLAGLALPDDIGDSAPHGREALKAPYLMRGWSVWPGSLVAEGYAKLLDHFREQETASRVKVVTMPYDWRLSNRYTALRLRDFIDDELSHWRQESEQPDAKAVIVAHSMGGLVARYCLEVLGVRDRVRRLITLGTPYRGSVKALGMVTGHMPEWVPGRVSEGLHRAAVSMPGLWQLLPTYPCFSPSGSDTPIGLTEARLPGLDAGKLADAVRFHKEIADAVAANGAPPYTHHVFVGVRQGTPQAAAATSGGRWVYAERPLDRRYAGDGTVPRLSAFPPEWPDDAHATHLPFGHTALPNKRSSLEQVWCKILAVETGATMSVPVELGLDLPDIAPSGAPLEVRALSNHERHAFQARLLDPRDMGLVAQRQFVPQGGGHYRTELQAPAGIWILEGQSLKNPDVLVQQPITLV